MESDIGIVAAFVFAHEQASKGMHQLVSIIEDGFQEEAEPPPTALTEMTLAEQARCSRPRPLVEDEYCAETCMRASWCCSAVLMRLPRSTTSSLQ